MTTHNTHNRERPLHDNTQHSQQKSMPQAGFEFAVPASERSQTHAVDHVATGTGKNYFCGFNKIAYFDGNT